MTFVHSATAVALGGRAVLIEGSPGSGKSSLALALIDRGAVLIGDDGVTLLERAGLLLASPPPNIAGLIEVRNVGLLPFPTCHEVPVALVLRLTSDAPRFIDAAQQISIAGVTLPLVELWPDSPINAIKTELALKQYGLS